MLAPEAAGIGAKLESIRQIVCHRNAESACPDGVASALLLREALPTAEVRFVHHGELVSLEARPGMLFCDIAPPLERAAEFLKAGAVVLDHHRTAKEVVSLFVANGQGAFADEAEEPGVSGALLAHRHVYEPMLCLLGKRSAEDRPYAFSARRFAELAGVRDTWQRKSRDWEEACSQAEALTFYPWAMWPRGAFDASQTLFRQMLDIGDVLRQQRLERSRSAILNGHRFTTLKGTRVLVVSTLDTSDIAEAVGAAADLVVGFGYRRGEIVLSTRSPASFDCAAFCRANGGGGHTRAAGCHVELSGDDPQPYVYVEKAVLVWEEHARGVI